MPVTTDLQEGGHILFFNIKDPWSVPDIEAAYQIERKHRDSTTDRIHVLLDIREVKYFPPGFLSVAKRTPNLTHPRRGVLAVIGASLLVQAMARVVMQILRTGTIKFFETEDEARVYLRQVIAEETLLQSARDTNLK